MASPPPSQIPGEWLKGEFERLGINSLKFS